MIIEEHEEFRVRAVLLSSDLVEIIEEQKNIDKGWEITDSKGINRKEFEVVKVLFKR